LSSLLTRFFLDKYGILTEAWVRTSIKWRADDAEEVGDKRMLAKKETR